MERGTSELYEESYEESYEALHQLQGSESGEVEPEGEGHDSPEDPIVERLLSEEIPKTDKEKVRLGLRIAAETLAQGLILGSLLLGIGSLAVSPWVGPSVREIRDRMFSIASAQATQPEDEANAPASEAPRSEPGGLFAKLDGQSVAFPLEHTEVRATLSGNVSRVEVRQTFTNPYDKPLEAVYQFPLPEDAAVDDMEIQIGNLIVRGLIKERQEAKKTYEAAKRAGKTAALLEQERPNLFTQSLANIVPGETIEVVIRYTDSLTFEGGDYEFAFPMVVGPRYIPGKPVDAAGNTDRVADAAKVTPPMLPPEVRSGHDINVTVAIDAGVSVRQVRSPSHAIKTTRDGARVQVQLVNQKTVPNKDMILRYQVAGKKTQATVLTQADERGGHFAVYLIPAVRYQAKQIVPKDVVFLIDTSGSQAGPPIQQSKELMRQFLNRLNPKDTFSIINFSNTTSRLSAQPLLNTAENRQKALEYINLLQADGGTELMNGIETAMNFPAAPAGRLRSIVMLTDGLIGDDEAVVGMVRDRIQPGNRVYTFGVGASTNRFLIERLAEVGRGKAEVLPPAESATQVAERFTQNISNPVVTNLEVTWLGQGKTAEIYPKRAPDLFANQPLVLHGRKADAKGGKLQIAGILAGGKRYREVLELDFEPERGNVAIAQLWGRARIKELMNQLYVKELYGKETKAGIEAVTQTALAYRLLSKYTAFVAVTEAVRVDPKDGSVKQRVPAETPEGMQLRDRRNAFAPSYSVPEPGEILGNLLALLVLVLWVTRKRLRRLLTIWLRGHQPGRKQA